MRISDRYIGRQILFGTLAAVTLLSMVLVLGQLFKQLRPLLVEMHAPPMLVGRLLGNALLSSLMYSIPWGFLSAVLLVLGRMSGAQEITGFRVAGMSLWRLMLPVFVLGMFFSGVCYWLNTRIVPKGKTSVMELIHDQAKADPGSLLRPGLVHTHKQAGIRIYVEDKRSDDSLINIHLYNVEKGGYRHLQHPDQRDSTPPPPAVRLFAGRATYTVDHANEELRLKLYNTFIQTLKQPKKIPSDRPTADQPAATAPSGEPPRMESPLMADEAEPYLFKFGQLFPVKFKPSGMTNPEIHDLLAGRTALDPTVPVATQVEKLRTELTRRDSFSMACLAFAFVAVPLGLQTRRQESARGLLIGLLIAGAYFVASMLVLDNTSGPLGKLMLWMPNLACAGLGLLMFRTARFK